MKKVSENSNISAAVAEDDFETVVFENTIIRSASEMFNQAHKKALDGKKADVNKKSYVTGVTEGVALCKRKALEAYMSIQWANMMAVSETLGTTEHMVEGLIMLSSDFYCRMSDTISEDNDTEGKFFDSIVSEFLEKHNIKQ